MNFFITRIFRNLGRHLSAKPQLDLMANASLVILWPMLLLKKEIQIEGFPTATGTPEVRKRNQLPLLN